MCAILDQTAWDGLTDTKELTHTSIAVLFTIAKTGVYLNAD